MMLTSEGVSEHYCIMVMKGLQWGTRRDDSGCVCYRTGLHKDHVAALVLEQAEEGACDE